MRHKALRMQFFKNTGTEIFETRLSLSGAPPQHDETGQVSLMRQARAELSRVKGQAKVALSRAADGPSWMGPEALPARHASARRQGHSTDSDLDLPSSNTSVARSGCAQSGGSADLA